MTLMSLHRRRRDSSNDKKSTFSMASTVSDKSTYSYQAPTFETLRAQFEQDGVEMPKWMEHLKKKMESAASRQKISRNPHRSISNAASWSHSFEHLAPEPRAFRDTKFSDSTKNYKVLSGSTENPSDNTMAPPCPDDTHSYNRLQFDRQASSDNENDHSNNNVTSNNNFVEQIQAKDSNLSLKAVGNQNQSNSYSQRPPYDSTIILPIPDHEANMVNWSSVHRGDDILSPYSKVPTNIYKNYEYSRLAKGVGSDSSVKEHGTTSPPQPGREMLTEAPDNISCNNQSSCRTQHPTSTQPFPSNHSNMLDTTLIQFDHHLTDQSAPVHKIPTHSLQNNMGNGYQYSRDNYGDGMSWSGTRDVRQTPAPSIQTKSIPACNYSGPTSSSSPRYAEDNRFIDRDDISVQLLNNDRPNHHQKSMHSYKSLDSATYSCQPNLDDKGLGSVTHIQRLQSDSNSNTDKHHLPNECRAIIRSSTQEEAKRMNTIDNISVHSLQNTPYSSHRPISSHNGDFNSSLLPCRSWDDKTADYDTKLFSSEKEDVNRASSMQSHETQVKNRNHTSTIDIRTHGYLPGCPFSPNNISGSSNNPEEQRPTLKEIPMNVFPSLSRGETTQEGIPVKTERRRKSRETREIRDSRSRHKHSHHRREDDDLLKLLTAFEKSEQGMKENLKLITEAVEKMTTSHKVVEEKQHVLSTEVLKLSAQVKKSVEAQCQIGTTINKSNTMVTLLNDKREMGLYNIKEFLEEQEKISRQRDLEYYETLKSGVQQIVDRFYGISEKLKGIQGQPYKLLKELKKADVIVEREMSHMEALMKHQPKATITIPSRENPSLMLQSLWDRHKVGIQQFNEDFGYDETIDNIDECYAIRKPSKAQNNSITSTSESAQEMVNIDGTPMQPTTIEDLQHHQSQPTIYQKSPKSSSSLLCNTTLNNNTMDEACKNHMVVNHQSQLPNYSDVVQHKVSSESTLLIGSIIQPLSSNIEVLNSESTPYSKAAGELQLSSPTSGSLVFKPPNEASKEVVVIGLVAESDSFKVTQSPVLPPIFKPGIPTTQIDESHENVWTNPISMPINDVAEPVKANIPIVPPFTTGPPILNVKPSAYMGQTGKEVDQDATSILVPGSATPFGGEEDIGAYAPFFTIAPPQQSLGSGEAQPLHPENHIEEKEVQYQQHPSQQHQQVMHVEQLPSKAKQESSQQQQIVVSSPTLLHPQKNNMANNSAFDTLVEEETGFVLYSEANVPGCTYSNFSVKPLKPGDVLAQQGQVHDEKFCAKKFQDPLIGNSSGELSKATISPLSSFGHSHNIDSIHGPSRTSYDTGLKDKHFIDQDNITASYQHNSGIINLFNTTAFSDNNIHNEQNQSGWYEDGKYELHVDSGTAAQPRFELFQEKSAYSNSFKATHESTPSFKHVAYNFPQPMTAPSPQSCVDMSTFQQYNGTKVPPSYERNSSVPSSDTDYNSMIPNYTNYNSVEGNLQRRLQIDLSKPSVPISQPTSQPTSHQSSHIYVASNKTVLSPTELQKLEDFFDQM